MNYLPCLVVLAGVGMVNVVLAESGPGPTPSASIGFSGQRLSFPEGGAAEVALRFGRDDTVAWVFSGGGRMTNSRRNTSSTSTSSAESADASFLIGQRRYTSRLNQTRWFGEALLGGIANDKKTSSTRITYNSFSGSSEIKTYSHSAAMGVGARVSVGGEYLLHTRAGIELSTSVDYQRLMWNFAETSSYRKAGFATSSKIGINWYW